MGEGGCGRVLTLDELEFKGAAAYDVMVCDQGGNADLRVLGRARSLRDMARIMGMGAVELFASAVYKKGLHVSDSTDEVIRTTKMLQAIARVPKGRRAWATVARTMPLLQTRDSKAIIVALRDCRDPNVMMPLYTRMQGSLFDIRDAVTGPDVLNAVRSVLDALAVLKEAGSHHRDVKDENVLWRTSSRGNVQYVLSDFGHIKIRPNENATASMKGTDGFMSPLMYSRDTSGKHLFQSHMFPYVDLVPEAVWQSYSVATIPASISPSQQLEKNDLYAVGIILYQTFHNMDSYHNGEMVRAFAQALVDGTGLWTIEDARIQMQALETKRHTYKRIKGTIKKLNGTSIPPSRR